MVHQRLYDYRAESYSVGAFFAYGAEHAQLVAHQDRKEAVEVCGGHATSVHLVSVIIPQTEKPCGDVARTAAEHDERTVGYFAVLRDERGRGVDSRAVLVRTERRKLVFKYDHAFT